MDDLLPLLLAGDTAAYERTVRAWSPAMLRAARRYVATPASAEEVVQETWLAVVGGLRGFEGRSSLRTWVFAVLANIGRRRGAAEARTVPWASLDADDTGATVDARRFSPPGSPWPGHWSSVGAPRDFGPEEQFMSAEALQILEAELAQLPTRQRLVVELRDVHGLTSQEVCTVLEITQQNQRVLLHRGRAALRQRVEDLVTAGVISWTS